MFTALDLKSIRPKDCKNKIYTRKNYEGMWRGDEEVHLSLLQVCLECNCRRSCMKESSSAYDCLLGLNMNKLKILDSSNTFQVSAHAYFYQHIA